MNQNEWERQMGLLKANAPLHIPHKYEIHPGSRGPNLYCGDCATVIIKEGSLYLDELVEEAMKHELNNHPKEKS